MDYHFTREVKEACELVGAKYQLITGDQAKQIYETVDKKFFTTKRLGERWEKRVLALEYTTRGGSDDAWRHVHKLTQGEPIYLMFNYDRDSNIFFFEDSTLISEILGECFNFVFYISDPDLSYLLFRSFHDVFVATGEKMVQRFRNYDFDGVYLVGAIKYQSEWRFFDAPVASWVLNYRPFNPKFSLLIDPNAQKVAQKNLLEVDETKAKEFLMAMEETHETDPTEIQEYILAGYEEGSQIAVVIDFDNKVYVNGYSETPLQNYIPAHWSGYEGSPLDYVPDSIKSIWKKPLPAI
jgi:hypothetical protein